MLTAPQEEELTHLHCHHRHHELQLHCDHIGRHSYYRIRSLWVSASVSKEHYSFSFFFFRYFIMIENKQEEEQQHDVVVLLP